MALPRVSYGKSDFGLYPAKFDADGNPIEGTRYIRAFIDVVAGVVQTVEFGLQINEKILSNVQAIFIDNSNGAAPLTVESELTKHRIVIPTGWQYVGPFLFANDQKMLISAADTATRRVFLFNMPHPAACWPATDAASGETVAATIADGADVAQGTTTDAAITNPASAGTVIAFLKGLITLDTALGVLLTAGNALLTTISATLTSLLAAAKSGTATPANIAMTGASVVLFASAAGAEARTIYNDGAAIMYVNFGAAASATAFVVAIQPQGYYELPQPIFTGAVNALAASGTARVMEQSA